MPHLQLTDATAAKAPRIAIQRSALQQAHSNAVARANKIAGREPNLLTTFALGDAIEAIEQQAREALNLRETAAYIALCAVATRLKSLIPIL